MWQRYRYRRKVEPQCRHYSSFLCIMQAFFAESFWGRGLGFDDGDKGDFGGIYNVVMGKDALGVLFGVMGVL